MSSHLVTIVELCDADDDHPYAYSWECSCGARAPQPLSSEEFAQADAWHHQEYPEAQNEG